MWQVAESVLKYVQYESNRVYFWAKTGESSWTTLPTILWTVGTFTLAYKLVSAIFRRFIFRRVPLWEQILQQLLFTWIVIYSLQLWSMVVRLVNSSVEFCYDNITNGEPYTEVTDNRGFMCQCLVWICGAAPLAIYMHTRPKRVAPPLMIWITTSPWQRREMGPYGYYLNRPLSTEFTYASVALHKPVVLRRAYSDSKIMSKEPHKKRRHSKSC